MHDEYRVCDCYGVHRRVVRPGGAVLVSDEGGFPGNFALFAVAGSDRTTIGPVASSHSPYRDGGYFLPGGHCGTFSPEQLPVSMSSGSF